VIEWGIIVDKQEEEDHVQLIGWNLAAMSKEDDKPADKLWKEREGQRARIDEECTGDEVEREVECWQEMLNTVLDAKAKKMGICPRSKRWWNGEIQAKRSALGRE
jgi:hypothetical protein